MVGILAYIINKEKMTKIQMLCMVGAFTGVYIVSINKNNRKKAV